MWLCICIFCCSKCIWIPFSVCSLISISICGICKCICIHSKVSRTTSASLYSTEASLSSYARHICYYLLPDSVRVAKPIVLELLLLLSLSLYPYLQLVSLITKSHPWWSTTTQQSRPEHSTNIQSHRVILKKTGQRGGQQEGGTQGINRGEGEAEHGQVLVAQTSGSQTIWNVIRYCGRKVKYQGSAHFSFPLSLSLFPHNVAYLEDFHFKLNLWYGRKIELLRQSGIDQIQIKATPQNEPKLQFDHKGEG